MIFFPTGLLIQLSWRIQDHHPSNSITNIELGLPTTNHKLKKNALQTYLKSHLMATSFESEIHQSQMKIKKTFLNLILVIEYRKFECWTTFLT